MSAGRLIGTVALVLALYAIITAPQASASTVRSALSGLGTAARQVTVFTTELVGNVADTTGARSDDGVLPVGGVDTGDGSTVIGP